MLLYLFMCKLYIGSLLHGFSSGSREKYCTYTQRKNDATCTKLAHCDTDDFNSQTGECGSQCEPGWMGAGCQYVNLAYREGTTNNAIDGHISTLLTLKDIVLNFNRKMIITSLRLYTRRNVALWKTARQSSTWSVFAASNAVDGFDGNFHLAGSNSCTHTDFLPDQPWWNVNLVNSYAIMSIRISNRNGFGHRMKNFRMYVANMEQPFYTERRKQIGNIIWVDSSYVPKILIDNITIESNLDRLNDNILTLCEVEIFACRPLSGGSENCLSFCPDNCKPDITCSITDGTFKCPECEEGWIEPFCKTRITCTIPPTLLPPQLYTNATDYIYGEKIQFLCKEGYKLLGDPNANCGKDFQSLLRNPPTCEDSRCNLTSYTSPQSSLHLQKELYKPGETIVFFCERGYRLEGVATATCGRGEQKLLERPPSCIGVRCPDLKLNNAVASTSPDSYLFPNIVHIACKPGYSTDNNDTILSCTADGIWNTSVPYCKENLRVPKASSMTVAIAASSAGAVFVIMGIVVFVTIMIRRERSRNKDYEEPDRETHVLEELDHQYAHISNYENPISPHQEDTEHPYSKVSYPHQNENA